MDTSRLSMLRSALFGVITVAAFPLPVHAQQQPDPSTWSREEKAAFLLAAKIVQKKGAPGGITGSQRATLQNERGAHDAHIQVIDESKARFESVLGTELNFRDTYKFNIAAYILDDLLGLHMIPVTVERKSGTQRASFTWWVDDILMDEAARKEKRAEPPDPDRWNRQMHIVRVFDQWIANTDRNLHNLLITKDWDIWMIDHTRAFRLHHDVREAKNLEKCDRLLLQSLGALNKQVLKEKLGNYLTGMEIDGLLARRDKIAELFEDKAAKLGEDAVLYDYLSQRRQASP